MMEDVGYSETAAMAVAAAVEAMDETTQYDHEDEGRQRRGGGQFGILAPVSVPTPHNVMGQPSLHFVPAAPGGDVNGGATTRGRLRGRIVVDPPDLQAWRERLFHVDEMIVLTEEEFETYFPHVDNVYSHRSTQKYKRKPFVSHYWDCRFKGRPPGTPKTDDPGKKRRRRSARERDLCDVKIKITEYFASPEGDDDEGDDATAAAAAAARMMRDKGRKRFWTIQRVNGNGGNGKGDGAAGPHKHTLARSDEIKKNSVQRHVAARERGRPGMRPTGTGSAQRTGQGAAATAGARGGGLRLVAARGCPFSRRVRIALAAKGLGYEYCETDRAAGPGESRVPRIEHGEWACAESTVILEYLEDLDSRVPLLPSDARRRADCRFWINYINTHIVATLHALERDGDVGLQSELATQLDELAAAADERGPYFSGERLGLVDVHVAPFAPRLGTVLGGKAGGMGGRWTRWTAALEGDGHVAATRGGG